MEDIANQACQAVITCQTNTRNSPASKILKSKFTANVGHSDQADAARVGGTDNASNACPSDAGNRNVMFLEYLKNANVREPARKAASQREAQAGRNRRTIGIPAAAGFTHQRGEKGVDQRPMDRDRRHGSKVPR
jgi:hypothetical protein